jgi:hypothetical protein
MAQAVVTGLSRSRTGFYPGQSIVALRQVSLPVFHISSLRIIPFALQTNLRVHVAPIGRTNGRCLETFKTTTIVLKAEDVGYKSTFTLVFMCKSVKNAAPADNITGTAVHRSAPFRGSAIFCDVANSEVRR